MVPVSHRESTWSSSYRKLSTWSVGRHSRCICTVNSTDGKLSSAANSAGLLLLDYSDTFMHHLAVHGTLGRKHGVWWQTHAKVISNALQNGLPVVGQQLINLLCRRLIRDPTIRSVIVQVIQIKIVNLSVSSTTGVYLPVSKIAKPNILLKSG